MRRKTNRNNLDTAMIGISTELYRRTAALLREAIGEAEWFNGSIILSASDRSHAASSAHPSAATGGVVPDGGRGDGPAGDPARGGAEDETIAPEWRLVLTAIVYRRDEELPEGPRRPIADVVPVWWEFRTGEQPNDFSFAELRPRLIDYD